MKIQGLFFTILMIGMIACKSDPKQGMSKKDTSSQVISFKWVNQDSISADDIANMRLLASNILDHRQKESNGEVPTIMEKDVWLIDAVVNGSKMMTGDTLKGNWIDFKRDMSYEYGKNDKIEGHGKFFYDLEKSSLLIMDDNVALKPQEFDVKVHNDILVLVGMEVYKDNNIQTKMTRIPAMVTQ